MSSPKRDINFSQITSEVCFSLVPLLEDKIKSGLPDMMGLMSDSATNNSIQYVSIIATYIYDGSSDETMLAYAPLLEEHDLSAAHHVQVIKDTLDGSKSISNVACFIGDNCTVNQRISKLVCIPLLGCCIQKMHLAVELSVKL